jgi:NAD(P)-dependent dehydrogenase (short-subunit alcohol dehydrogenase family)
MTNRFAGRRALVTGASRGIGAAVAVRLAAEGADVAIVARTERRHDHLPGSLADTAARIAALGRHAPIVVADLADAEDRARIVSEAADALDGRIDILVNNAAAAMYAPVATMSLKRRRVLFEVNAIAPLDLAQAVVPGMVEAGEGWIVNLTSATARAGTGDPTMALYGASKAALNRVTDGLARELFGTGVRVNAVEPRAAVLTEGAAALVGDALTDDVIESLEAMTEAVVCLCDCPPELTGRVCVSLDLIDELGLTVYDLDGVAPTSGAAAAHPGGSRPRRGR